MTNHNISNLGQFIKLKYNIFIDADKLEQINKQISEKIRGGDRFKDINMFCDAVFGIDFSTLCRISKEDDWINFEEENCTVRKSIQKKLIELEKVTTQKISELEREIENLKITNEELRTSYWNLKHGN